MGISIPTELLNKDCTNIFSLGGIEEIGKNMFLFEYKDEM
jgi:mRNA degradation ribonuclease J1/J2